MHCTCWKSQTMKRRRKLFVDKLEKRIVLSASPWQNPLEAMDVNHDSFISPIDALLPINMMNESGSEPMRDVGAPPILAEMMAEVENYYVDANGDGYLSPADALSVINLLAEGEYIQDWEEQLPMETHDTFPDSPDNAAQLDLDWGYAFIESEINNAYDVDAFQFVATDDRVAIDVFNEGIPHGVVVELLNQNMELVARAESGDDYQWCEGNIDVPVEVESTYFVMVSAYAAEDTGHYILDLFQYEDDWWEPAHDSELGDDIHGDTIDKATALTLEWGFTTINSYIDQAGDIDQFSVQADQGQLSASIYQGDSDELLRISVTDTDGNLIGLTQGDAEGAWIELSVEDGTYYVAIESLDSNISSYTLDVSQWSDELWELDADSEMGDDIHPNEIGADATFLEEDVEYDYTQNISHLDFEGDLDVYQFVAGDSFASVSVYANNWEAQNFPGATVYDATGIPMEPVLSSEYEDLFDPTFELYVRDEDVFDWEWDEVEEEYDEDELSDALYEDEAHDTEDPELVRCWFWPGGMYPVTEGDTYFIEVNGGLDNSFSGQYTLELSHFSPGPYDVYLDNGYEEASDK